MTVLRIGLDLGLIISVPCSPYLRQSRYPVSILGFTTGFLAVELEA